MTEIDVRSDGRTPAGPTPRQIHVANTPRRIETAPVEGGFVTLDGERFYRISRYDRMEPFFMSIVSHSDHWMFVSSSGALTAGRKNPEHALFPYYTVDKIHDSAGVTGGKTLVLAEVDGRLLLWEPFARECDGLYDIQRNLYKNKCGNKLLFEEVNRDLELVLRTLWTSSEQFGFVRYSRLQYVGDRTATCRVLDGIQNLLPCGTDQLNQNERSTLLDAYKKNELLPECGLGLFLLSSIPVDKPEPSEALGATTVWSVGLNGVRYLLSSRQLGRFRNGEPLETETSVRAQRGAYFVEGELTLRRGEERDWYIVAEVDQGPADVADLRALLKDPGDLRGLLEEDVDRGTNGLSQIVAGADGLQLSADELSSARHYTNVLFNVMRGGTFADGYRIDRPDLLDFIGTHNRGVLERHRSRIEAMPDPLDLHSLLVAASDSDDPGLIRLCREYLPLSFSRRHGDPSRPWNYFSIDLVSDSGARLYSYQGNWRDIFQNWEALCASFPNFAESVITKFVDASTADGYNPYRITRDGIDWELLDPEDPWSFIGYWGDHQIIYLLKLLEISRSHDPQRLESLLAAEEFAFANVPYRIKSYESLLEDPHDTIVFDDDLGRTIEQRVRDVGADGRLLWDRDGAVQKANLTEKLLISVLAKLSNFVPEGGIWMNTQRPEWNDANNALVGYGVSMVTLCYLRRFQAFARRLFESVHWSEVNLSREVADLLAAISGTLSSHRGLLSGRLSDVDRKMVLDELGSAGSVYRESVYARGFSGEKKSVRREDLLELVDVSLEWADHTIRANRREDGLYHAYNLLTVEGNAVSLSYLYEMLEGQVAVLSSGLLSAQEAVEVLGALKESRLFRADQYSYLLYPDRELPLFVQKNIVPDDGVAQSALLSRLLDEGNTDLVARDVDGIVHFNPRFRNRHGVMDALDRLAEAGYAQAANGERARVLELFERVFEHRSYTGRSGTFYGYEGLGCIYWHMVSKLLLAAGEAFHHALEQGADSATLGELVEHYYGIRAGIGLNKSPDLYGAFPTDPYSHTPANAGAKQPGMTGQVKEDVLARWLELGVLVIDGCLTFRPALLRESEFLTDDDVFDYYDVRGQLRRLDLREGDLAFTYGQVPVVYRRSDVAEVRVRMTDGSEIVRQETRLDDSLSREVFGRTGRIDRIDVYVGPELLV